jgi:hypothetical protein
MMMGNLALYELGNEYVEALDYVTDPENEVDEQTMLDTLEGLGGELEAKAVNVIKYQQNLTATVEAIKEAEQKMAARRWRLRRGGSVSM